MRRPSVRSRQMGRKRRKRKKRVKERKRKKCGEAQREAK
jgi:hypothetical protein